MSDEGPASGAGSAVRRAGTAAGGPTARLVSDLVQIPTVNPPGGEAPCAAFIDEFLRGAGVATRLIRRPAPDRPQVLGMLGSGTGPVLALNGHMDVVSPGPEGDWQHPPFSGTIAGGHVYGRGAADMKGGLAAMLLTGAALADEAAAWRGTLLLQFVIGEETGEPGTLELLKERPAPDWGIVCEPTGLKAVVAARGLLWWELVAHGRAAHAGTPHEGINAVDMVLRMLANLPAYQADLARRTPHPLLGLPGCSITTIAGGVRENVVPDRCSVLLDRRTLPGEDAGQVRREIEALWPQDIRDRTETLLLQDYDAAEIPADAPIVRELRSAMTRVLGHDHGVGGEPAATDARNFIVDAGVPAVLWGPGEVDDCHIVDESVAVAQVDAASAVLVDLCRTLLA